jgi:hypothetical protein
MEVICPSETSADFETVSHLRRRKSSTEYSNPSSVVSVLFCLFHQGNTFYYQADWKRAGLPGFNIRQRRLGNFLCTCCTQDGCIIHLADYYPKARTFCYPSDYGKYSGWGKLYL